MKDELNHCHSANTKNGRSAELYVQRDIYGLPAVTLELLMLAIIQAMAAPSIRHRSRQRCRASLRQR
jgi:hypothetical protein